MKVARLVSVLGVGMLGGTMLLQGCSSDSTGTGNGTGPGTNTEAVGQPPAKPTGAAAAAGGERNFAMRTVSLGDRPRGGTSAVANSWKKFGYNIDGKVTTRTSTDVCKAVAGAGAAVKEDGENGNDNSFGANILPIILNAAADAPNAINKAITDGKFTIMFLTNGLDDSNSQSATGLSVSVLAGGDFGGAPTFTKTDNWPVRPETLSSASDPKSSTIKLTDAYVNAGTFVARGNVKVSLVLSGNALDLSINSAIMTFKKNGAKADEGTIAGVVSVTELLAQLKKVAGNISPTLCGSGLDAITDQIKKQADIMADGSAGSQDTECNAISIAIGFTADEIAVPTKVSPPANVGADPCAGK